MELLAPLVLLDTPDFEESVASLRCKTAVFDCDGTLWSGDAGTGFMAWSVEINLVSREASDWLEGRYQAYRCGEVSEEAICGEMVQVYQGLAEGQVRAAAREFFETRVEGNIFPELRRVIKKLQVEETEIWAVSSTNKWVIEEAVREFGIGRDHVLAAEVAIEHGLLTGRLVDVPTDEGKVAALARVGVFAPDAVFGNSVHDAAMLALARRAFPVNPTPALAERSATEGWSVYYPASVRPPNAG